MATPKSEAPILYEEDGSEIELPWRWEICGRCHGNGSHVNPAVDGWSRDSEWADDDFIEGYFEGRYDVRCEEGCDHGKIRVPDESRMTPALIEAWHRQLREEWEYRQEVLAERRMGA